MRRRAATIAFRLEPKQVSFSKLGSWYLLLDVSFVSVSLICRSQQAFTESRASKAPPPPG